MRSTDPDPPSGYGPIDLEFVLDSIPALVSYVDADHRYRFNNRAYVDWFGAAAADLRGRHIADVLGPRAYDAIRPYIELALSGEPVQFETLAPYKDGGPRDIHASYVPDRDEHGRVRGFVAIVEDVTEKNRTMRVIRSADERLMLAADAAGLGDWSVDPAAGEVVLSDRAATIFGVAPGRHRRTDLQALIDPEDLVSRNAWVAEALRTHKHFAVQYRIVRPDGSRRWVSGRGRGVYSDAGELTGIAGVVQDITAGKETELALAEIPRDGGNGEPSEGRIPRDGFARAAHAAQCDHGVGADVAHGRPRPEPTRAGD